MVCPQRKDNRTATIRRVIVTQSETRLQPFGAMLRDVIRYSQRR